MHESCYASTNIGARVIKDVLAMKMQVPRRGRGTQPAAQAGTPQTAAPQAPLSYIEHAEQVRHTNRGN